jgi:hypothetical protein
MKIEKIAVLAAAFAALAGPIADVRAATETSVNFVMPDDSADTNEPSLFFNFANAAMDGDWISGDSFVDQFLFNLPQAAAISFSSAAQSETAGPQVSFSGFELIPANGDPVSYAFGSSTVTSSFMTGAGLVLDTGTYDLVLSGTFLASNGAYGGTIVGTSAIPEPGTWLLMLGGIAAIAATARRRGAKQEGSAA